MCEKRAFFSCKTGMESDKKEKAPAKKSCSNARFPRILRAIRLGKETLQQEHQDHARDSQKGGPRDRERRRRQAHPSQPRQKVDGKQRRKAAADGKRRPQKRTRRAAPAQDRRTKRKGGAEDTHKQQKPSPPCLMLTGKRAKVCVKNGRGRLSVPRGRA